ncbi:MAG: hypothetical protein IJU35_00430, partial [Paludibacteraceae bacterium]|nr:hypothetical protein [Paludibacteraceae bacterium]
CCKYSHKMHKSQIYLQKKKLNNPTKQIHFLSLAAQLFAYNAYKFASFACMQLAIPHHLPTKTPRHLQKNCKSKLKKNTCNKSPPYNPPQKTIVIPGFSKSHQKKITKNLHRPVRNLTTS